MNKEPWIGSRIRKNQNVLLLAESFHIEADQEQFESDSSAGVIKQYISNKKMNCASFFDRVAASFGYESEYVKDFFDQVCFGFYADEFCGIKEGDAEQYIGDNRIILNNELFDFINEHEIDTMVCFSKTIYNYMATMCPPNETEEKENVGRIGRTINWVISFCYMPEIDHAYCDVKLKRELKVYVIRHPLSRSGFDSKQLYTFFNTQSSLKGICYRETSSVFNGVQTDRENVQESLQGKQGTHENADQNKNDSIDVIKFEIMVGLSGNSDRDLEYLGDRVEYYKGHPFESKIIEFCENLANESRRRNSNPRKKTKQDIESDKSNLRESKIAEVKEILSSYERNPVHTVGIETIDRLKTLYGQVEKEIPKSIRHYYMNSIRADIAREADFLLFPLYNNYVLAEYRKYDGIHLDSDQYSAFMDKAGVVLALYDLVSKNVENKDTKLAIMYEHMLKMQFDVLNVRGYEMKWHAFEVEWILHDEPSEQQKNEARSEIKRIQKYLKSIRHTGSMVGTLEEKTFSKVERSFIVPQISDYELYKRELEEKIVSEVRAIVSLYIKNPTRENAKETTQVLDDYYSRAYVGTAEIGDYYHIEIRNSMAEAVDEEIMSFWRKTVLADFRAEDGEHHTEDQLTVFIDRAVCCKSIIATAVNNTDIDNEKRNVPRFNHMIEIMESTFGVVGYEKKKKLFGVKWIPGSEMSQERRQAFENDIAVIKDNLAQLNGKPSSVKSRARRSKAKEILDNPVVKIAASYALGKAVTNKLNQSPMVKNPNAERYREAQQQIDMTSGDRIPLTTSKCATCVYWCGQRQIAAQPRGKGYVQLPKHVEHANCSKRNRTIYTMETRCRDWTPLG